MKKIELYAATKLIRNLLPALERAGVLVPLSITPMSQVSDADQTKTEQRESVYTYCKCEIIVPDSLADHVVEVVARLPKDLRFAGLLSRLVVLEIDENYYLGSIPLGELATRPQPIQRSRRLPGRRKLNQPE